MKHNQVEVPRFWFVSQAHLYELTSTEAEVANIDEVTFGRDFYTYVGDKGVGPSVLIPDIGEDEDNGQYQRMFVFLD